MVVYLKHVIIMASIHYERVMYLRMCMYVLVMLTLKKIFSSD